MYGNSLMAQKAAAAPVAETEDAEEKDAETEEGAEGTEGAGEAESGAPKRLAGRTLILFIMLPILLLLGGAGAGLYFTGIADGLLGIKHEPPPPPPRVTVFHDLPDMLVNLNTAGRRASFLKLRVSLELEQQSDVALLEKMMPRVIDTFQVYLRELRIEDLQGSAGLHRLREELLARVNKVAQPVVVRDLLFKDMLIQ
jgi:flagellar protein FliL